MTTRHLQKSQVGFHFTLGSPYKEEGDYGDEWRYYKACVPAVEEALSALPFWKQTEDEANDVMQIAPYSFCDFDAAEIDCFNNEMTCSFWIESQRVALFPKEHITAMREAIASVMAAKFVRAQSYQEYSETGFTDLDL